MNHLSKKTLQKANEEAIYNIYIYLAHITNPVDNESLKSIVINLESDFKKGKPLIWKQRDIYRLNILINAVKSSSALAKSTISNLTRSKSGLTACSFTKPTGDISVVFKGTGSGEWIDNGEGLSGIAEENTYITYGKNGEELYSNICKKDYASDQQVEALNWFNSIASKGNWSNSTNITVSGHSKGGNKAQFIAVNSDLVKDCYSFDGQGFSKEALDSFKKRYSDKYDVRCKKIMSFSSDNDYVNVLGKRIMPQENIYFFKSQEGFHYLEAMLDNNGKLRPQCEQGKLSKYVETVSTELMDLDPFLRQYATLGVMNVFQKYLGEGIPVNGDKVSIETTIAGIGIAITSLLHSLHNIKDIKYIF